MSQEPSLQPDLYDPASLQEPQGGEIIQARRCALHLLQAIFVKRHNLDQVFDESKEFGALTLRDRAFVKMMVTTTIRRLGQIDDLIRRSLSRPGQSINPPILEYILRLGVAQLVFMHVPDHAAVNTSVQLVELEGHGRMKGFANAVLRRIGSDGKEWTTKQDIPRLNTPEWLLKIWIEDFGLRSAIDISMANIVEPPLDVTLKNNESSANWAETLQAKVLPTGSLRLTQHKLVQDLPGYEDGMWWVQDAAAAIPARLFGNIEGQTVYDLCAAPGGKTSQLAAMGANVISVDRSAKRLLRLQENMRRLRLDQNVKTEVADAAVWKTREPANFILLDAPCSATGTIRRNPDVPWLKTQADLNSLVDLQAKLLENSINMLAPGGTLVYCTCSLQKAEGENQIEKALNAHSRHIERIPVATSEVGGLGDIVTPNGDLRIFPSHLGALGGMDGFFISRLRKRS
jgi:16S rRNA (cytosine967-C5)-methyltransferase